MVKVVVGWERVREELVWVVIIEGMAIIGVG